MKQRDLVKKLKAAAKARGVEYREEQGSKHMKVWVGDNQTVIPRHNEVNEITAKAILKQMGVE